MRTNTRFVLAVVLCSLLPANLKAQDHCSDVLRYAAKNETLETYYLAIAMKTYESVCAGETYKSGTQFDAGLGTIIEAIPIDFNLGSGSTQERTRHFCRSFFNAYKQNEAKFKSTTTVVVEAVGAWENCMTLRGEGVEFRPRVSSTQVLVEVRKTKVGPTVKVEGVTYDDQLLDCDVPHSDSSSEPQKATNRTTKTIHDDFWTITCKRRPMTLGDVTTYPRADLSVATTKGPFLLLIPADAQFPHQWAKEFDQRLTDLKNEADALKTRVGGLRTGCQEVNSGVALSATHTVDLGFGVRTAWVGLLGNVSNAVEIVVKEISGSRVTVYSTMRGGGPNGGGVIRYRVCGTSF